MATYVMLSTLGPQGSATLSDKPERLRQVNEDVESMGATVLHQWALLGQWDFLTVLEAPDSETVARVATSLSSRGTLKTRTMAAIEVEDFIAQLQKGI